MMMKVSIGDYKSRHLVTAVQLTVALVVVMSEEVKPVGMPQLTTVVNDVEVLYELDPQNKQFEPGIGMLCHL